MIVVLEGAQPRACGGWGTRWRDRERAEEAAAAEDGTHTTFLRVPSVSFLRDD